MSYSKMVEAHEKSVSLGGAITLFPVTPGLTQGFARNIRTAIERAEAAAYDRGCSDQAAAMRRAIGL